MAYHCELADTFALPIASSFGRFLSGLLHDAEATLREAARTPGGEPPTCIPGGWPLDLKPWVGRDPELRRMLLRGELADVYRGHREYAELVESALWELETCIVFENQVRLHLFPVYTSGYENWMLYTPDGAVLIVGPGSNWHWEDAGYVHQGP